MTDSPEKTILIVEDDEDAAAALQLVLEDEGYAVVRAPDADAADEAVRSKAPDLILLDVMMPDGTEGFHFVWKLRRHADPALQSIPIILLTAIHQKTKLKLYPDQSDGVYQPYEYLPVEGFLDKPASSEELISEVKRVLTAQDSPQAGRRPTENRK